MEMWETRSVFQGGLIAVIASSFAGKVTILLNDARGSQLPVARDRVRLIRSRMEF